MSLKSIRAFRALVSCSFALALCAPSVFADPLPVELAGAPSNYIKVTTSGAHAFTLNNGGGGFAGQVWEGQTNTGPSHLTTMWCIDSQLQFTNGSQGLANINLLSSLPTDEVRYGEIGEAGNPYSWTNSFTGVLDTAAARFQMAAWLVQQYSPFPNGPSPSNDPVNKAIQRSIWAIIHNNTPGADAAGESVINGAPGDMTQENYWVDLAKANYGSVDTSQWAIVSWLVDENGVFAGDARQTFLVQVTPEPGFYAVLGIGLILLLMVRRRRQNTVGELAG